MNRNIVNAVRFMQSVSGSPFSNLTQSDKKHGKPDNFKKAKAATVLYLV
jgi:hypothetical protein